jgi:hypothetical protein
MSRQAGVLGPEPGGRLGCARQEPQARPFCSSGIVIGRFGRRACTVGIPRIRRYDYAPAWWLASAGPPSWAVVQANAGKPAIVGHQIEPRETARAEVTAGWRRTKAIASSIR